VENVVMPNSGQNSGVRKKPLQGPLEFNCIADACYPDCVDYRMLARITYTQHGQFEIVLWQLQIRRPNYIHNSNHARII